LRRQSRRPNGGTTTTIITLTTDFGTRDSYVAEMKGVILQLAPSVRLVDVSHDVEPQQITEAALAVEAAALWFPPGTIHLAVVDPGVGTARRGLVVAARGQVFVGPDNGLFTPIVAEADADWQAFELAATELRLPKVSRTFHGRDIFAPAAAHLALGVVPARFGPPIRDPVRLTWARAHRVAGGVAGRVIHVDRFGNLVTSIAADEVDALTADGPVSVRAGGRVLPLVGTYGELPPGGAGALVGSRNRLEIAIRDGSAAASLNGRVGLPVVLSRRTTRSRSLRSRRSP
jgi:S-adenosylmethionine hydrolase